MVKGAQQVGGEDEAALEDRNHQQRYRPGGGDRDAKLGHPAGDLRLAEQHVDHMAVDIHRRHGRGFTAISAVRAKLISSARALSGGDARRVVKPVASPGLRLRVSTPLSVQA